MQHLRSKKPPKKHSLIDISFGLPYSIVLPWQLYYHFDDSRNYLVSFACCDTHTHSVKPRSTYSKSYLLISWSHGNKQDPARNLSSTTHQTRGINSRRFHFLSRLMTISQRLRINGNTVMRKLRWLARQQNAIGPEDSPPFCFTPPLTMHLINCLFCFIAVFHKTSRCNALEQSGLKVLANILFDSCAGTASTRPSRRSSPSWSGSESPLCLLNNESMQSLGLFTLFLSSFSHLSDGDEKTCFTWPFTDQGETRERRRQKNLRGTYSNCTRGLFKISATVPPLPQ